MTKREAGLVLGIRYTTVVSFVITLIGITFYHSIYYHSFDNR